MKKTLLLSVVASTMIMAGGDIAPVEPVVEAPVVEESGFTVDKVSGYAKLWYETTDADSFFAQGSSSGEAVLSIKAEGKAGPLGYGLRVTGADTLGLENNVVSSRRVWNQAAPGSDPLETVGWVEEGYITYTLGNTTAKIGRQHLDTPFAFTEKWNAAANSFDAAVLINNDIDKVTLIAAYVGRGNGLNFTGNDAFSATLRPDANFRTFGMNSYKLLGGSAFLDGDGAYAFAALTKPMDNLAINGWYYNVEDIADAYWIDATFDAGVAKVTGIYAGMNPKGQIDGAPDSDGWAAKVAGSVADFSLMAAYSSMDDGGLLPLANVATGFKKTKLPTAGIYTDGHYVAMPGADAWKVKAATKLAGVSLAAQYVSCENDNDPVGDSDEFDFIVGGQIADLDIKAMYINRDFGVDSDQEHIRIITTFKF